MDCIRSVNEKYQTAFYWIAFTGTLYCRTVHLAAADFVTGNTKLQHFQLNWTALDFVTGNTKLHFTGLRYRITSKLQHVPLNRTAYQETPNCSKFRLTGQHRTAFIVLRYCFVLHGLLQKPATLQSSFLLLLLAD